MYRGIIIHSCGGETRLPSVRGEFSICKHRHDLLERLGFTGTYGQRLALVSRNTMSFREQLSRATLARARDNYSGNLSENQYVAQKICIESSQVKIRNNAQKKSHCKPTFDSFDRPSRGFCMSRDSGMQRKYWFVWNTDSILLFTFQTKRSRRSIVGLRQIALNKELYVQLVCETIWMTCLYEWVIFGKCVKLTKE